MSVNGVAAKPATKVHVGDRVAARVAERAAAEGVRAVFVDEGGIGAGVVDRLEHGLPLAGVAFHPHILMQMDWQ